MIVQIRPRGRNEDHGNDYSLLVDLFNRWCFCDGGWGESDGGDSIKIYADSIDDVRECIAEICKDEPSYEAGMLILQVVENNPGK